jgi:hypothetical protein
LPLFPQSPPLFLVFINFGNICADHLFKIFGGVHFRKLLLRGIIERADNIHPNGLPAAFNMAGDGRGGYKAQHGHTRNDKRGFKKTDSFLFHNAPLLQK